MSLKCLIPDLDYVLVSLERSFPPTTIQLNLAGLVYIAGGGIAFNALDVFLHSPPPQGHKNQFHPNCLRTKKTLLAAPRPLAQIKDVR